MTVIFDMPTPTDDKVTYISRHPPRLRCEHSVISVFYIRVYKSMTMTCAVGFCEMVIRDFSVIGWIKTAERVHPTEFSLSDNILV